MDEFKKNIDDLRSVIIWVDHLKNNSRDKEVSEQLMDKLTTVCSAMITVNDSFSKKYYSMKDEIDCYKRLVKKMKKNSPTQTQVKGKKKNDD